MDSRLLLVGLPGLLAETQYWRSERASASPGTSRGRPDAEDLAADRVCDLDVAVGDEAVRENAPLCTVIGAWIVVLAREWRRAAW